MKKRIICLLAIFVVLAAFSAQAYAATNTYTRTWSIYNAPSANWPGAICVGKMTMYAQGDTTLHKVYNVYELHSTKLGGFFTDTRTWIVSYPDGDGAWCTSTYNFGIPTPWGTVGYQKSFALHKYFF